MASRDGQTANHRILTDQQRLDWLRLIRSENVGPTTFRELINHFGSSASAIEALPELSKSGGARSNIKICRVEDAEAELRLAEKYGAFLTALGEPSYPPWLAMIDAPPPLVYLKGNLDLVGRPMVAIVGSRNGSAIGQKFTRQLAVDLGIQGFVIVSGLARGIDTAAHVAALQRGTLAVLAGGIDTIYPPENDELHAEIGQRGLLISEMPMGYKARGQDFPRRNRLISGVSLGVVVVEAAKRSGSLITARMAGEQGREVFAVPGNPLDPRAAGTNRLLRDGAGLVTSAQDVVDVLKPIMGRDDDLVARDKNVFETGDKEDIKMDVEQTDRQKVTEALGFAPIDVDEVIRATKLPARHVQIILLELDLAGRLERHGNQLVSLKDTGSR